MTRSRCHRGAAAAALITAAVSVAGCIPDTSRSPAPFVAQGTASPTPAGVGSVPYATTVLRRLPVKGRAPKTGYARSEFGPAWTDVVDGADGGRNGCSTRDDVLRRDLRKVKVAPGTSGCTPASGRLEGPYTGVTIPWARGPGTSSIIQIDHVVALSDAWQKGAQQWTPQQRRAFANDPLNLLAVYGAENAKKGDGDAATWLPAARGYRCPYVARQAAVKDRYGLWVTPAERDAITHVLQECPTQRVPTAKVVRVPAPTEEK